MATQGTGEKWGSQQGAGLLSMDVEGLLECWQLACVQGPWMVGHDPPQGHPGRWKELCDLEPQGREGTHQGHKGLHPRAGS